MPHAQASGFPAPCERVSRAMRLAVAVSPHHPCRAGSPDPAPFGIGRARTTLAKVLEGFGYRVQRSVFEATQTRPLSEPPRDLSAREREFSINLLEN